LVGFVLFNTSGEKGGGEGGARVHGEIKGVGVTLSHSPVYRELHLYSEIFL